MLFKTTVAGMLLAAGVINFGSAAEMSGQKLTAVPFTDVAIDGEFWGRRIETNRNVTIWYDFDKCEETGRIDNFAKAGGLMEGGFEGIYFNDSDVFKVIEGAAYSLKTSYDAKLDKYLDGLIAKIAAAQEDDGYLYTNRTINPAKAKDGAGSKRWSKLRQFHELYNVGHMYEAAVAHYQATGKHTLLEVAIKNADLVDEVFGDGKKIDVPGHEEIEIGLVKLYQVTNEKRYLDLAKFFIDMRGRKDKRQIYGAYCQDHKPVIEQVRAVGHAVRAGYLYSGMADVAAHTGEKAYIAALDKIWHNVVSKQLYLTGGVGSSRGGEAFGDDYELPNKSAYNETCAAIANALWNHRMFLLHGHARYLDVLERVMYNGFLSGISLGGDRFFYPNPLASDGDYERSKWFGCACCPVNIVRFIPSLSGYVYARRNREIYVNLYAGGCGTVKLPDNNVKLIQQSRYPWDGDIKIKIEPEHSQKFTVYLRIPGWAREQPVPSDLYRYLDKSDKAVTLKVNGRKVQLEMSNGFAGIDRAWQKGDVIDLHLPMPVRRVQAHEKVAANSGRLALERGPLVYCLENVDNPKKIPYLYLSDDVKFTTEHRPDLLGGVTIIKAGAHLRQEDPGQDIPCELIAIPYYAWAHRGGGPMAVWLPASAKAALPRPLPTIGSNRR